MTANCCITMCRTVLKTAKMLAQAINDYSLALQIMQRIVRQVGGEIQDGGGKHFPIIFRCPHHR